MPKPDPVQPPIRLAHEDIGEKFDPLNGTPQKWVMYEFSRDHVDLMT